ncbi:MAG: hypothetical protein IJ519_02380 [Clostridia bacterium]|nr:hypothetical protein [Clostridia bacterium]
MKKSIKKLFILCAVPVLGICAVLFVTLLLFHTSVIYPNDHALTDKAFRDNKGDIEHVAEFAYDLYEDKRAERNDLEYVYIRPGTDGWQVWYGYDKDISHWEAIPDNTFKEAVDNVDRAFPSHGDGSSVHVRAQEGMVEFVGYEYSLIYSADGGKPSGFDGYKLKRVDFFSDRWYHCYTGYTPSKGKPTYP